MRPEVDIAALARKHGPKCIEVVAGIIMKDRDEKMRHAAAVALLHRGWAVTITRTMEKIEAISMDLVTN